MKRFLSATMLMSAAVFTACSDTPERVCVPGRSEACVGQGGCAGGQVCNAGGTAWGACACADDSGATDAGTGDGGQTLDSCDLVAQTGCKVGERCAWIVKGSEPSKTRCVGEGTAQREGQCAIDTAGIDDCIAGLVCQDGFCVTACDPQAQAGGTACSSDHTCVGWSGLTREDGERLGTCVSKCDPVTQVRLADGAAACGSIDPGQPSQSCVGIPGGGPFVCAKVLSPHKTHGVVANEPGGSVYLNSCAAWHLPLLVVELGSQEILCTALCAPAETHSGSTAQKGGADPWTCAARGVTGENVECRFWSLVEGEPSEYSNTVGFCVDPTTRRWDDDNDPATATVPWPRCVELPNTDTDGDGTPQHEQWGCGPIDL